MNPMHGEKSPLSTAKLCSQNLTRLKERLCRELGRSVRLNETEVPTLEEIWSSFARLRESANSLLRYKGNKHYRDGYTRNLKELNREVSFFKKALSKTNNKTFLTRFQMVLDVVTYLLSNTTISDGIKRIDDLEIHWPEFEAEFKEFEFHKNAFEIPKEVPMTEYRLDLEEAIRDYDFGSFLSSLVMCRRSYEGALVLFYEKKEGKKPIENGHYIGVTKLHKWAVENGFVPEKMKEIGFLLTDMSAGAAHPPLADFPRDSEIAKLGIYATIALLKQLSAK
jgi:hypothetical protein